jgi:tetratricopeptide (TPR) repeat protein
MGLTLHDMGRFEEAREVFRAALKMQQRYHELEPGTAATIAQAWTLISAIKTERRLGDVAEDLRMSTEVLRLAKSVCTDVDDRGQQDLLASAHAYYAYSLRKTDLEQAAFHQRQARQIRERLTLDEEDLEAQMILAVDLSIHGEILSGLGRIDEALAVRQQLIDLSNLVLLPDRE